MAINTWHNYKTNKQTNYEYRVIRDIKKED